MIHRNQLVIKLFFAIATLLIYSCGNSQISRPNVLLIVADDMNYDSPGFAGGIAPDITPNIDRLASEGFVFGNAFVTVSVCQPSRQSMLTGLLPHHYGSTGFFPMAEGTQTLPSMLGDAGYLTAVIHKEQHLMPLSSFNWTYNNEKLGLDFADGFVGRHPDAMADAFRKFVKVADEEDKPFFMMVNSSDPHRPFHGDRISLGHWYWGTEMVETPDPSRIYKPEEITVPAMLPDIPGIRKDLAKYASSVRRLDDCVGKCLKVLEDLDKESSTLVIFVSDNGMPLPYAKFDCYIQSNRTPLLMKWPELIKKPVVENDHLISLMDITPTVLELAGVAIPDSLDGKTLVPFLKNQTPKEWRESIVFLRNDDIYYPDGIKGALKRDPEFLNKLKANGWIDRPDHPEAGTLSREKEIRAHFDGRYGYIYNNCYSDELVKPGELGTIVPYGDPSFFAMKAASKQNKAIKERYDFYLQRVPEELYDWTTDPGSKNNLIDDPQFAEVLTKARTGLLQWMKDADDPLMEKYKHLVK